MLVDRVSRFVGKDGQAFLALLEGARALPGRQDLKGNALIPHHPEQKAKGQTAVCSKTLAMLQEAGVQVETF